MKNVIKLLQVILLFLPLIGIGYALLVYDDQVKMPDVYLTKWFAATWSLWQTLGPIATGIILSILYT